MPRTQKKIKGSALIDVVLVVIRTGNDSTGVEYALDTANQIQVEPQTETVDPIRLVVRGKLIAQKPQTTTITGHQITLTDNVFSAVIMKILQGGQITGEGDSAVYTPPVAGSDEKGEIFELDAYSAEYDAAGTIVRYEKITYPNCQGTPVTISRTNDEFSVPEYVINSAPKSGEAPYKQAWVTELPTFSEESTLMVRTTSRANETEIAKAE